MPGETKQRWTGDAGTTGTVAVIGMGKIGLPLAMQYADAGWQVLGVDILPRVVEALNEGRPHFAEEPGVAERLAQALAVGRFEATLSHADAAARADVVVMIVPLVLSDDQRPDYRIIDSATRATGEGLRPGTLVVYETTLPVGDTRDRFGPLLEAASGLPMADADKGFLLAFSPERVYSGRVFRDLATYPKLVGGVDPGSELRAAAFYGSVLPAEVWTLGSAEAAELAKLAETTYRDVNIALANELARYADRIGVDIVEVIRGANSQPYSHLHDPGIGVGGHCIPVYPHFLLDRAPELQIPALARKVNDGQVGWAVQALERELGPLESVPVLVLGLTYRENVRELAYSRALPLIEQLRSRGAQVSAYDPLMDAPEVRRLGATPYEWGTDSDAHAIVVQTADTRFREIDFGDFPALRVIYDGRNRLRDLARPEGVIYLGVGRRGGAAASPRDPSRRLATAGTAPRP